MIAECLLQIADCCSSFRASENFASGQICLIQYFYPNSSCIGSKCKVRRLTSLLEICFFFLMENIIALEDIFFKTTLSLSHTHTLRMFFLFTCQVQNPHNIKYNGTVQGLKYIWNTEGFRGLFKGNGTNCARIVPNSAVKFFSYEQASKYVHTNLQNVHTKWNFHLLKLEYQHRKHR